MIYIYPHGIKLSVDFTLGGGIVEVYVGTKDVLRGLTKPYCGKTGLPF